MNTCYMLHEPRQKDIEKEVELEAFSSTLRSPLTFQGVKEVVIGALHPLLLCLNPIGVGCTLCELADAAWSLWHRWLCVLSLHILPRIRPTVPRQPLRRGRVM